MELEVHMNIHRRMPPGGPVCSRKLGYIQSASFCSSVAILEQLHLLEIDEVLSASRPWLRLD